MTSVADRLTRGRTERRAVRSRGPAQSRLHRLAPYVFMLPWFVGIVVLTLGPVLASLYLSFTDFDLFTSPRWVGLANYRHMFTDDSRWVKSVVVTFTYVVIAVPLKLLVALGLALVLNRGVRGLGVYRSVYYLPSLLGGSVAIAIMWQELFTGDGVVNDFLGLFGIHGHSWISDPKYALYTLVLLAMWQFGSPMLIFLAGLKQVPAELYDAARVDGAGRIACLFRITLPLLTPIIFFNLLMQMVDAFQAFTPAYIIGGGKGGPLDSLLFYTLYLYQEGFTYLRMGYASAMAWVLLAIIAAFTAIAFGTARFWVHYGEEG